MAEELKFNINELNVPEDKGCMKNLFAEATPAKIPVSEDETLTQRVQRMSEQSFENQKVKKQKDILKASQQYPELGNIMYQLREGTVNENSDFKSELFVDTEGKPALHVWKQKTNSDGKPSLADQMDGARGFGFSIHDGKIVLDSNLSDEQLLEALDFLYRRGITNYEKPNKRYEEVFEAVTQKHKNDNSIEQYSTIEPFFPEDSNQHTASAAIAAVAAGNTPTIPDANEPASYIPQDKEDKKEEIEGFKKANNIFVKFLEKEQNKRNGLSYFIEGKNSNVVTYSVYNNEDADNLKNDGKKDSKTDVVKETCAYRVRLTQKDGKLSQIEFHVPNGGKMPEGLADKAAEMVKSQGALYLNCPDGLSPADAKEIRNACARAGILPKGIGINLNHATKMDEEATTNITNKDDLYAYKGKLGRHLMELCTNDKDPRIPFAQSLINQEKLYPLTTQLEGCLTNALTQRIDESGDNAHKVLGAAETIKQIFTAITNNPDKSVAQLCETLSRGDDTLKTQLLQAMQNAGAEDIKAHELKDDQMMVLFSTLEPVNIEKEKQILDDEIRKNHKDSKETIIERRASKASRALNTTINKVLKDKVFKNGFSTIDFGDLKYTESTSTPNTNTLPIGRGGAPAEM